MHFTEKSWTPEYYETSKELFLGLVECSIFKTRTEILNPDEDVELNIKIDETFEILKKKVTNTSEKAQVYQLQILYKELTGILLYFSFFYFFFSSLKN